MSTQGIVTLYTPMPVTDTGDRQARATKAAHDAHEKHSEALTMLAATEYLLLCMA